MYTLHLATSVQQKKRSSFFFSNALRPPGEPVLTHTMAGHVKDVWRTFFNDDQENDIWHMYMMRDPGLQMYIKGVCKRAFGK